MTLRTCPSDKIKSGDVNCNFSRGTLCDYMTDSTSQFLRWTHINDIDFEAAMDNPPLKQGKLRYTNYNDSVIAF